MAVKNSRKTILEITNVFSENEAFVVCFLLYQGKCFVL